MRTSSPISLTPFVTQIGTHSVARCGASSPAQARQPKDRRQHNLTTFTAILRGYAQRTELERAEVESMHLALCMLYVALFWAGAIAALFLL